MHQKRHLERGYNRLTQLKTDEGAVFDKEYEIDGQLITPNGDMGTSPDRYLPLATRARPAQRTNIDKRANLEKT